jgi:Tfp pilus assembly protein PilF
MCAAGGAGRYLLVALCFALGLLSESIDPYREALRLQPGWTVVRNNLQLFLTEQVRANPGTKEMTQQNKQ